MAERARRERERNGRESTDERKRETEMTEREHG